MNSFRLLKMFLWLSVKNCVKKTLHTPALNHESEASFKKPFPDSTFFYFGHGDGLIWLYYVYCIWWIPLLLYSSYACQESNHQWHRTGFKDMWFSIKQFFCISFLIADKGVKEGKTGRNEGRSTIYHFALD